MKEKALQDDYRDFNIARMKESKSGFVLKSRNTSKASLDPSLAEKKENEKKSQNSKRRKILAKKLFEEKKLNMDLKNSLKNLYGDNRMHSIDLNVDRKFSLDYINTERSKRRNGIQAFDNTATSFRLKKKLESIENKLRDSNRGFCAFVIGDGLRPEFSNLSKIQVGMEARFKKRSFSSRNSPVFEEQSTANPGYS